MNASPVDLVPLFARREPLLSRLSEGTWSKSDLVDSLDVSRSTVDRCVRKLETAGLVERREGNYGLSLTGRLLFEEYVRFCDRASSIGEASEVLSAVPADVEFHADALVGANVTVGDRTDPYRPAEAHLEQVRGADRVSIVSTATSARYVDTYREAVVDGGLDLRLVVTDSVASVLVSEYGDALADCFAVGRLEMFLYDGHPPYSLSVVERPETTHLGLLVYDEGGARGYISCETDAAVEYGHDEFERYLQRSTRIPDPSVLTE